MKTNFDLSLYLVTDRTLAAGRDLTHIVKEAVTGGATMVQLREKDCSTKQFVEEALRLKTLLAPLHIPLIINDRIDVALAADADGVHIGQSDMPYTLARQLMGPDKIIGLSVENMAQLMEANTLDVDYIGISPVFATPTKTDTATPFGLDGLRQAVTLTRHRTVGIGGIKQENLTEVIQTGVGGVAVVSAIIAANQPAQAAQQLYHTIQQARITKK